MPLSRTARALSATAFTTLVLGTATTAATANSGAEVSPRTVAPGGTVTVSVTCGSTGGHPPESMDATSEAFEHGTVRLHRTGHRTGRQEDPAGADDPAGMDDPAGTDDPVGVEDPAGMDDPLGTEDEDAAGTEDPADVDDPAGVEGPAGMDDPAGVDELGGRDDRAGKDESRGGVTYSGTARISPAADFEEGGPDGARDPSEWRVDGVCPAAPGAEGKKWSASFTVSLDGSHNGSRDGSRGVDGRHGVHAGQGGTFNDSTLALVSGGVLIAGALGAAVHKLRHREPSRNA
ncbi:hypothetical protein OHS59_09835 [Streptomyces sp. NBC_00414]|uniref:hypothetical protein n=1 Tax=Streptomyces sp. NBC_00414 TaxID=2975739 RepID=UPI002E23167D